MRETSMDNSEKSLNSTNELNKDEQNREDISLVELSDTSSDLDTIGKDDITEGGCRNVRVFMVLLCLFGVAHGFAINGVNNVNVQMYERRFHLTSMQTGLQCSFYDIISLLVCLLSGCFLARFNQPRLLGVSAITLALGSFVMALPHFLTGDYHPKEVPPSFCSASGNDTMQACETDYDGSLSNYLYMFLFGQTLHGIAGTLLYVVGPAFIDSSVSDKQSPVYIGIFYSTSVLGPCAGYLLGGWLLEQYVDTPKAPPAGHTTESPAWVGAWWIGFLITSAITILLAFPLLTFPKVLPGTESRRKKNVSQAHTNTKHKNEEVGDSFKDIPKVLKLFAKNPAFLCQCVASSTEAVIVGGVLTFATKFVANQFSLETGKAAMISGIVGVPSTFLGQILGGLLIKKFDLKVRGIIKLNILLTLIGAALTSVYWIKCDQAAIAGVTTRYNTPSLPGAMDGLTSDCNKNCGCDTEVYDPICIDGVEYFTPCHAGCSVNYSSGAKVLHNCTCAGHMINSTSAVPLPGKCGDSCTSMYFFLPAFGFVLIFTFILFVPATTVTLRCVSDNQRTFAMAIKQFVVRLFGSIPGPLLFGAILDNACMVWQEGCGGRGSCWIYDTDVMSRSFFIIVLTCKVISTAALLVSYKLYTPPRQEDNVQPQQTENI